VSRRFLPCSTCRIQFRNVGNSSKDVDQLGSNPRRSPDSILNGILRGKTCLVTGAAWGFGRAVAAKMAGESAYVVLVDRNAAVLERSQGTRRRTGALRRMSRRDRPERLRPLDERSPCGAGSTAIDFVRPITPPLAALYDPHNPLKTNPAPMKRGRCGRGPPGPCAARRAWSRNRRVRG